MGIFPCQRIELENGEMKMKVIGRWRGLLRLVLWLTLAISLSFVTSIITYQQSDFPDILTYTDHIYNAINFTVTDTVTWVSTMTVFGTMFYLMVTLSNGLVEKLIIVAESFGPDPRPLVEREVRAKQMSSILKWFYM